MAAGDACLLDSNILLRISKRDDPQQAVIGYALHVLVGQGVGQMLTMNSRDFRRFDGLQIRHPIELS
jgi:hypothetical protein